MKNGHSHGGVQTPAFWIANSAVYRTPPRTALENATPDIMCFRMTKKEQQINLDKKSKIFHFSSKYGYINHL